MNHNQTNQNVIKLISWNANGIKNKIDELQALVDEKGIDVIFIQESRLNKQNPPKLKHFEIINKPKTIAGGLLIYINKRLQFSELKTNTVNSETIAIFMGGLCLINYYHSPSNQLDINELNDLLNLKSNVIAIGDFNCKHINWNNSTNNGDGMILERFLSNSPFIMYFPSNNHTHIPNNGHQQSTIDLAVTNSACVKKITCEIQLNSDHYPVFYEIQTSKTLKLNLPSDIKITDWTVFRQELEKNIIITP